MLESCPFTNSLWLCDKEVRTFWKEMVPYVSIKKYLPIICGFDSLQLYLTALT